MSETLCPSADDVICDDFAIFHVMQLVSALSVSVFSPSDRTVILSGPQALKVQPGNTAIFTCLYRVDAQLGSPLIQWRKNDQKLFESHSDEK